MATAVVLSLLRKWSIPFLIMGMILDLAISGIAAYAGITAHSAISKANIVAVSQYESCLDTNRNRVEAKGLWMDLFELAGNPNTKIDQEFKADIAKTYAPERCKRP